MKQQRPIDSVIALARGEAGSWCATPLPRRIEILNAFAEELRKRKSELGETISEETGKPRWESVTEVDAMINKVALSIQSHAERRSPKEAASAATRYKPHGVLAVLGPFNFPGHLPNGHIAPALLAGNVVIFKPSEHTPRTADLTVECWHAAGLPQFVLQLAHGGREAGELLVSHRDVDGVLFTGSLNAGRAINRALADHPNKIVALEMGGNNPLVVHNVADLRAAAYLTIQSAYITAGQRCSCARRLIVVGDADPFIETLVAMISHIRVGLYTDTPEPFMGPVINAHAAKDLLDAQRKLIADGGLALVEMKSLRGVANLLSPGLIDTANTMHYFDEELFGPLLQLIRVDNLGEAIAEANETQYGLCAGLLSDDRAAYDEFYAEIRAGVINWNRALTGASSALPFGGVKNSGNHRPSAYFAADYCSYPVASMETDRVAMPENISPGIVL